MPPVPIPDTPQTRQDTAAYHAGARILDEGVGKVLAALDHAGLSDNTLLISTTDHGVSVPLMKCNLEDFGWGVSLIMRGPGGFTGGKVCDALISHLDVFPTICDITQLPHPTWLEGKSLLPIMRGEAKEIHDEVFAEVNYHAAYEPKRAVRTPRWKSIRCYGDKKTQVLPNCDDGLSKSLWLEYEWKKMVLPEESFYDLIFGSNGAPQSCPGAVFSGNARRDARAVGPLDENHQRSTAAGSCPCAPWSAHQRSQWLVSPREAKLGRLTVLFTVPAPCSVVGTKQDWSYPQ